MSTFPFDAVIEILLRLPVESLIRFKRLSKECCGLIESPYFINLHKHHSTNTRTNLSLLCTGDEDDRKYKMYEADLESIEDLNFKPKQEFWSGTYDCAFRIFGSCNGLIALFDWDLGMRVCNPATKQHKELPSFWEQYSLSCYGFGYDVISDDYKLVWMARKSGKGFDVIVYSLKNNSTTTRDCSFAYMRPRCGVLVGGYLHWVAFEEGNSRNYVIVALEVGDESFGVVSVPDELKQSSYIPSLGVLDELLTMVCKKQIHWGFEIWIMKEYGVKNSWIKLCSIPQEFECFNPSHPKLRNYMIKPLCYSKGGNKILLQITGYNPFDIPCMRTAHLLFYDLQSNSIQMVKIGSEEQGKINLFTTCFVRSFVSLP